MPGGDSCLFQREHLHRHLFFKQLRALRVLIRSVAARRVDTESSVGCAFSVRVWAELCIDARSGLAQQRPCPQTSQRQKGIQTETTTRPLSPILNSPERERSKPPLLSAHSKNPSSRRHEIRREIRTQRLSCPPQPASPASPPAKTPTGALSSARNPPRGPRRPLLTAPRARPLQTALPAETRSVTGHPRAIPGRSPTAGVP